MRILILMQLECTNRVLVAWVFASAISPTKVAVATVIVIALKIVAVFAEPSSMLENVKARSACGACIDEFLNGQLTDNERRT